MPKHTTSTICAAIAEQEEHIKRVTSCGGVVGVAHSFRTHGTPATPLLTWEQCIACGVTETSEDYYKREQC